MRKKGQNKFVLIIFLIFLGHSVWPSW